MDASLRLRDIAVEFPIYAGLYMPDLGKVEDFREAIRVVHHRGGAGVSLFGGVSDAHWKAFEAETG